MDNRDEVRDFLRSRRARITPDQAGLPAYGTHRRVPGLRREEVAMLAGVSSDYYVRLERGNLGLGRALYAPLFADGARTANHARFAFLDPGARDFWVDWERAAHDTVGVLRSAAGRDPFDKALTALVGELSTRSEEFRRRWATHHVHLHTGGTKKIHHPVVGRLELMYDSLQIAAAPGLTMLVYTAQPGTPTADALRLLASWDATASETTSAPLPAES